MWTRFQPIAYEVEKYIHNGVLGRVKRVWADNSVNFELDSGCSFRAHKEGHSTQTWTTATG